MALVTFVAGDVLEAQQLNDSFAAVRVVRQIVVGQTTSTFTSSSTSYVDFTSVTLNITPSSASSTILVIATNPDPFNNGGGDDSFLRIVRNGTAIGPESSATMSANASSGYGAGNTVVWQDSPSTTSQVTYKAQVKCRLGASLSRRGGSIVAVEVGP